MTDFTLLRISNGGQTFGVLKHGDTPFALTLERGWRDNRRGESCIPDGVYTARRCRFSAEYGYADSPQFGDTFVVENVPNRKSILFHKGNIVDDTHGCIIVGEEFGELNGELAVIASHKGFSEFKKRTSRMASFTFAVKWAC